MTKGFKDPCAAITPSANSGVHPIVAARPAESEFHRLDSIACCLKTFDTQWDWLGGGG